MGLLSFAIVSSAQAAPAITAGSVTNVGSGGTAPGSATDYVFFGNNGNAYAGVQPTNLTNFTLSGATNQYGNYYGAGNGTGGHDNAYGNSPNPPYASVTAPGGGSPFVSGITYAGSTDSGPSTYDLFTLTLTASNVSNFTFYVLVGNSDQDNPYDTAVGVSSDGGPVVSKSFTEPDLTHSTPQADFVAFSVTGATSGDTFDFYATTPGADNSYLGYIGGVTADVTPAPEPGTLALLGFASLGLLAARRAGRA